MPTGFLRAIFLDFCLLVIHDSAVKAIVMDSLPCYGARDPLTIPGHNDQHSKEMWLEAAKSHSRIAGSPGISLEMYAGIVPPFHS
jgi:hypothetical protein